MEDKLTFPVSMYPEVLQKIIEDTHQDLNFPVNYIASSMLVAASLAIGNSRILKLREDWVVKSILYMALIGEPGAVKSHPINFALAPFRKSDEYTLSKYRKELAEYRSQAVDQRGDKPKAKQFLMKDFTPEAVAKVLDVNPHGICIHSDELNGWFASFNKYNNGGGEQEMWLSLQNGGSLVVNRKGIDDIILINDPHVDVLGSIQPKVLAKCFRGQKTDNGFLYRMLFAKDSSEGMPLLWRDEDLPTGVGERWKEFVMAMLEASRQYDTTLTPVAYNFHPDAWDIMRTWQNDRETDYAMEGNQYKVAIFRKIQDYALRFCLIIHAMRETAKEINPSVLIDSLTVAKSIRIATYFFDTALDVYEYIYFGSNAEDSKIVGLLDFLPEVFTKQQAEAVGANLGISRSTIHRHIRGDKDDPFTERLKHGLYRKKF